MAKVSPQARPPSPMVGSALAKQTEPVFVAGAWAGAVAIAVLALPEHPASSARLAASRENRIHDERRRAVCPVIPVPPVSRGVFEVVSIQIRRLSGHHPTSAGFFLNQQSHVFLALVLPNWLYRPLNILMITALTRSMKKPHTSGTIRKAWWAAPYFCVTVDMLTMAVAVEPRAIPPNPEAITLAS